MEPDTLVFDLSKEIKYGSKGDFKDTLSIELNPPGIDQFDDANDLSQLVTNAVMDAGSRVPADKQLEEEDKKKQKNPTAKEVQVILMSSERISFNKVFKAFSSIACKCGTYDGKERLKTSVFKKMGVEDARRCMCEYIANFIFPSLFSDEDSQSMTGLE